eukprot:4863538-Pyramimonas_sp.AAC.1
MQRSCIRRALSKNVRAQIHNSRQKTLRCSELRLGDSTMEGEHKGTLGDSELPTLGGKARGERSRRQISRDKNVNHPTA